MSLHSHNNDHPHGAPTEGKVIHWAGWYEFLVNRVFGGLSRRMRVGALRQAGLQPGSTILDFGCGAGDLAFEAERLIEGKGKIIGIDPASEMIAVAKKKASKRKSLVQFQVEAAEKLSFPDNTFDVVMSSFVLHHLPGELKAKAFQELRRVLKPGGLFFSIDMTGEMHAFSHFHVRLHGEGDSHGGFNAAAETLRASGFRDVAVDNAAAHGVGVVRGIK